MSWSISIFAGNGSSLEDLVGDLSRLLSIDFKLVADYEGVKYTCLGSDADIWVFGEHGLVNDRDMRFEEYAWEVNFKRRGSSPTRDAAEAEVLQFAWSAFSELKESCKYRLMLVENVQRKLASFDPERDLIR
jgi:hypothetical protein